MKIIFFGAGYYVSPIVEMLLRHNLALVITSEKEGELIKFLQNNKVNFLISDLKEGKDTEEIKKINPDLGILASFGYKIDKNIINLFKFGILNIHPSLIPKYKGPSPVQETILNGEKNTGITIMKLDEEIDHGSIIEQEKIELNGTENAKDLTEKLFSKSKDMIEQIILKIEKGEKINEKDQDFNNESFTKKIAREDGFIDSINPPDSKTLDRMIRAYYPWPGAWTKAEFNGKIKRVKLLPDNKIQVEGTNIMTIKDFINGYQKQAESFLLRFGLFDSSYKA